ncbi:hypothetical protein Tsubulata_042672 [Turnera subulata]|uniref:DUF7894 domain-containing protein n=1 Tax=Turnera subulata TaxID=218843 RepID=A0A9Q0GBL3_9ROSI|nr:hypothetical protein Tsubulata_042672 [Turnera subulata]
MKVASKVVFLFKDPDGLATAIADSLHPHPNSSLRSLTDGSNVNFLSGNERLLQKSFWQLVPVSLVSEISLQYQVSVLLLEMYEPPILACALNEVLTQFFGESGLPTLVVPFVFESSKLKLENKTLTTNGGNVTLYGVQIGQETDRTRAIAASTKKAPSSLQIHHEPLACFLQLARVLKLSVSVVIGYGGQSFSANTFEKELEVIYEIGELLANTSSLCFLREKIKWNPVKTSRETKEPWRALYG